MTSIYISFIILGLFWPYVLGKDAPPPRKLEVTTQATKSCNDNSCETGSFETDKSIENYGDNNGKHVKVGEHNEILWEYEKNHEDRNKDPSMQDRRDKYKETSKKSKKNHEAKKKYRFKRDGPGSVSRERVSCKLWWRVRGKEDCCKSFRKGRKEMKRND